MRYLSEPKGGEEPETLALMKYIKGLGSPLVGMAALHEGALVVNIPYDGTVSNKREPNPTPDDKLFRYLAGRYVAVQPQMQMNKEFPGGIVQGSFWYPVYGGMQDWAYLVANVYAITIEMDNVKFSNKVQQLWDQHHDSMFELIKANLCQGVTVQVNTQSTGGQGVKVSMATPQMGRPAFFPAEYNSANTSLLVHESVGSAGATSGTGVSIVHYPTPPGEYEVVVEWLNETNAVEKRCTHTVVISEGQRTSLAADSCLPKKDQEFAQKRSDLDGAIRRVQEKGLATGRIEQSLDSYTSLLLVATIALVFGTLFAWRNKKKRGLNVKSARTQLTV
mmetsp:Transcript_15296/g.38915  ORF Transcript_15296/g.38915 Transcript_15296/m.38915 type:complete len:334 (-) Transcript_15296:1258-2259(-)